LGQKICLGRNEGYLSGAVPKSSWFGIGQDAEGNVIQEAPLQLRANFRQRSLDPATAEIAKKTDLSIEIDSLERSKHRRVTSVTFSIREQAVPEGD
jgi:replication initiator protein